MKDLTEGSIAGHLIEMAMPMAIGMFVQTLYYLVDLYFVGRLGDAALAGVSTAANVMFITIAFTQILGVATVALIAHAVGRKDRSGANLVFNQALLLSSALGVLTLAGGYLFAPVYLRAIAADPETLDMGTTYLHWFLPCMAAQFAIIAIGSALRGTGIVKPTMVVQVLSVAVNIVLAPVLIAGWGTGRPLGVAGAGLASSIAAAAAVAMMWLYFQRLERYVGLDADLWRPQPAVWRRMLGIGIPAGGEMLLVFFYMAIIYWAIRGFGADAQAGFGLGQRLMQSLFLPAMAVAFAAPAVAGQNFGAARPDRVRETARASMLISAGIMTTLTLLCQWRPAALVGVFTRDPGVIAFGETYLRVISWNFVFAGIGFSCSGMFQALGNTWPAILSSSSRLFTFVIPLVWLTRRAGFTIEQVWHLSVVTVALQCLFSLWLLRRELRLRLVPAPAV